MLSVKICGLTNLDDAEWALGEGADYLGFVLYPGSPRCVTFSELSHITTQLPGDAKKVGVFVNEAPMVVKQVVAEAGLTAVQLHGDEDPLDFLAMPVPVWRAIRLKDGRWSPNPLMWMPERFVLDAFSPAYGGTGTKVDWDAAQAFAAGNRCMLAGGLHPDNVAEAIRRVRPSGVDVSSGVEREPGRKDHAKITAFIRAARGVETSEAERQVGPGLSRP